MGSTQYPASSKPAATGEAAAGPPDPATAASRLTFTAEHAAHRTRAPTTLTAALRVQTASRAEKLYRTAN